MASDPPVQIRMRPMSKDKDDEKMKMEERLRTCGITLIATATAAYILMYLKGIIIPFVLAYTLKLMLTPIVDILSVRPLPEGHFLNTGIMARLCPGTSSSLFGKWKKCWKDIRSDPRCQGTACDCILDVLTALKFPRWVAVFASLLITFFVLGRFGFYLAGQFREFGTNVPKYTEHTLDMLNSTSVWMGKMGLRDSDEELINQITEMFKNYDISGTVFTLLSEVIDLAVNFSIVILFALYLMIGVNSTERAEQLNGEARLGEKMQKLKVDKKPIPEEYVSAQVQENILTYIRWKVIISAAVGVLTAFFLNLCHVDLAFVWGVLAFLFNFVPNVGAVFAVLLPMPLAIFDPDLGSWQIFGAFFLPATVHGLVGNVVEPVIFGDEMELHPAIIMSSLMLWGSIWGTMGCVLAVPIMSVLKIYLSHIDHPTPKTIVHILEGKIFEDSLPKDIKEEVQKEKEKEKQQMELRKRKSGKVAGAGYEELA